MSSLLLLTLLLSVLPPDEVGDRLRQLSDPSVRVREGAERWLGAHLRPDDVSRLAEAAGAGDLEVRRRLGRALALADLDLTMSTALLARRDDVLQALGESALRDRIARWNPRLADAGLSGPVLQGLLERMARREGSLHLALPDDVTLGEACALLGRHGAMRLGLSVDADLEASTLAEVPPGGLHQGWNELLLQMAFRFGVTLEGHGLTPDPEVENRRAFLHFTVPSRAREGSPRR